jgi:D-alanyl-D-alanine endopeptidase (penicillin-binding protein 7)
MRLALMASDNRATTLRWAALIPTGTATFVAAMNTKAKLLGLMYRFVDPTGLAPGNVASPQTLALMVSAASPALSLIRSFSTAPALNARSGHRMVLTMKYQFTG